MSTNIELNNIVTAKLQVSSLSTSDTIITNNMQESAEVFRSASQITPIYGIQFLSNVVENPMSRREVAEIQLHAILNDPEGSLPRFSHEATAMSVNEVAKQLNTPTFIIERLLHVISSLSGGNNSSLTSQKNVINLTRVLNSTLDVRILLFFMMLDEDGNNHITKNEMSNHLQQYLKSISADNDNLQNAVQVLIDKFYSSERTEIDFEEFYIIVTKDPTILKAFSQFAVNPTWFILPLSNPQSNIVQQCCASLCSYPSCYNRHKSKLTPEYFYNNLSYVIWFILYILVNIGLILYVVIYRSVVQKDRVFLIFARIAGILLNFNCALIVILMLKQTILYIRSIRVLRQWIPVDEHIDFHKFIGRFIAFLAIFHTISHMINFTENPNHPWVNLMFTTIPKIGWVGGFAPLSGLILLVILAIIIIFSMNWIRQRSYFRIFYWTHQFYIVFYIFLIIHAQDFWKWSIGPLVWFSLEKLYSILSQCSRHSGRSYLISATIEQSNVISLKIYRPKNFTFKAGDYININLPQVALYEFHPFTISSAPEEAGILRVHIQAIGHWTQRVYQRFKDMSENNNDNEHHIKVYRADQDAERAAVEERNDQNITENENNTDDVAATITKTEIVIINGPYSSCARHIFDCEHVVLISGGIGVTPYASILSSLMAQFRASHRTCQHCQRISYDKEILLENRRIRKVDFIWVSRDHKSFEWFFNLLNQFEQEQESYLELHPNEVRFLTIHLYLTAIKTDDYIGYYPLELITQVWAQVTGKDVFTGLKAQTHIGRPPWSKIFTEIRSSANVLQHNNVNVFFCGPSAMGETIQQCCIDYNFRFYEEKF